MIKNKKILNNIVKSLNLCKRDYYIDNQFIQYENDITMRIFHVFYRDKFPICAQTQYGKHYNDLTILGKKENHIIEVKKKNINKSFKDSQKIYRNEKKWMVSFWIEPREEGSSIPQRKTLDKIKEKILKNKNIFIHGTIWDNDKVAKLMKNAQDSGFITIKTHNINKYKWRVVLFYSQNNKPVLDIKSPNIG